MFLTFKAFDGRGQHHVDVVDRDTGKTVGLIHSHGVGPWSSGGIDVSLFDGKYRASLNRYDHVVGFLRGVEAVLNHLTHVKEIRIKAVA